MKRFYNLGFLLFLFLLRSGYSQIAYQHVSNTEIYAFLDEMASEKLIELNSAVKPYSRIFIAEKLNEVSQQSEKLNKRQQNNLHFYLKDYNKELLPHKTYKKRFDILFYKDSLFTFSLDPILGFQYWNNESGSNYHRWNGAEVFAYVGKHLGVYANLRDNHEDKVLSDPLYLDTRPGARYKSGQDFSEMRGGITYSWKWGDFGLVKDHMEWGTSSYYSSILSAKVPSFTQIKLHLKPAKWFEFNYFHGWLNSGVVDSTRSYSYTNSYGTSTRIVYRKKYLAANLYTFRPFKNLNTSIGNSIIYSDQDVNPSYLIPFFLYKSADHSENQNLSNEGGQNSQFYIDISSYQIRKLHLYMTLFFDDVSISRLKENGHLDYYSLNAGFRVSGLIPNIFFTTEYFQSYPLVYKHDMPTTTYESNRYNLGHYMQDNSRSIYLELAARPFKSLHLKTWFSYAQHGPDHEALGTNRIEVVDLFLKTTEWESTTLGFEAGYQVVNDVFVFGSMIYQNITGDVEKYTAEYYHGITSTFSLGINYGF